MRDGVQHDERINEAGIEIRRMTIPSRDGWQVRPAMRIHVGQLVERPVDRIRPPEVRLECRDPPVQQRTRRGETDELLPGAQPRKDVGERGGRRHLRLYTLRARERERGAEAHAPHGTLPPRCARHASHPRRSSAWRARYALQSCGFSGVIFGGPWFCSASRRIAVSVSSSPCPTLTTCS